MLASSMPSAFLTTVLSGGLSLFWSAAASFSPSSSRPSVTVLVSSLPLRMITTGVCLPTGVSATTRGRSRISLMSLPSNFTITSPGSMPAGLGGPLSSMPAARTQRAAWRAAAEPRRDLVGPRLDTRAEPAAPGLAELLELIDHRHRGFRRHREADADRAAGGRDDRCIDADHLAVEVEQRAAGIAAVDGGVGLNVVVVGSRIDVTIARRDDASGDGAAEAERVADGDNPFAQSQLLRIAELDRLERLVGLEPEQRDVGFLVLADELGLEARTVVEDDGDLVGFRDHVVVGDHDTRRIDDEAGAERVDAARSALAVLRVALAAPVEEVPEQLVQLRI